MGSGDQEGIEEIAGCWLSVGGNFLASEFFRKQPNKI
jgi:hypothetical protein